MLERFLIWLDVNYLEQKVKLDDLGRRIRDIYVIFQFIFDKHIEKKYANTKCDENVKLICGMICE